MKRAVHARSVAVVLLGVSVFLLSTELPAAQEATVTVLAIRASNEKKPIDPRLKELAAKLRKLFPYQHFELDSRQSQKGDLGKKITFRLPEKHVLKVTALEKREDGTVKVRCVLMAPDPRPTGGGKMKTISKVTVTLPRREYYPVATLKSDHGVRIILISAE